MATKTARSAYGLSTYNTVGSRTLVGDGQERYWIDSTALYEKVPEAKGDALASDYARWCSKWHAEVA
jgi:hypothetical protein